MLHPVATAFRQIGSTIEAARVAVYALDLPGEDPTSIDFRVWLAFEEAIEGRPDKAEGLLIDVDDEELDDVPRILHSLTRGLIDVQRKGRPAFVEARDRGREAVRQFAPKDGDADLALSYQRWAKRLSQDAGGIGAWVWATFSGKRLPGA